MQGGSVDRPQPRRHSRQQVALGWALSATGDRWTLLIALALDRRARRPIELRRLLPGGVSAGVLDRHLQQMVALGLLLRRRFKEMPPRVEFALTEMGRDLLPSARALARWGEKHL